LFATIVNLRILQFSLPIAVRDWENDVNEGVEEPSSMVGIIKFSGGSRPIRSRDDVAAHRRWFREM
jgi:hypothetical protein